MRLELLLEALEKISPKSLAEEWDNPGLLVEPVNKDIKRVLVALDATVDVAREAHELGAELVLTHHPLFFTPVRSMYHSRPDTAAAYALIRNGIGLFAAHTNLDAAVGGVNDQLAKKLGLNGITPLGGENGLGRVGLLNMPVTLKELAIKTGELLNTLTRVAGNGSSSVKKIAVVGGSGGSLISEAAGAGADALVTGELKHSDALDAAVLGLNVIAAGHYETECVVLEPWIDSLQTALKAIECNVEFICAKSGRAPIVSADRL